MLAQNQEVMYIYSCCSILALRYNFFRMNELQADFSNDISECLHVLHDGGIILYPTDTVWGIGCDATNVNAVNKVIELKQRPANKSFVVLVAEKKDILTYTASPDLAVFDYLQTMQKPTTVIYDNALGLAENILGDDGSVAIRICKDDFCYHLIKRFRKPIVSTSANISGNPYPVSFSEIAGEIKQGVGYVVAHRQQEHLKTTPSSVIRWSNGKIIIIRP